MARVSMPRLERNSFHLTPALVLSSSDRDARWSSEVVDINTAAICIGICVTHVLVGLVRESSFASKSCQPHPKQALAVDGLRVSAALERYMQGLLAPAISTVNTVQTYVLALSSRCAPAYLHSLLCALDVLGGSTRRAAFDLVSAPD
eukprot:6190211-Pleurochrysis_carterae.AAC.3